MNQCLQNLEIPEIELMIDPEINRQSENCKRQGTKFGEECFAGIVGNPEFVNRLENGVKQWIKDIGRVT